MSASASAGHGQGQVAWEKPRLTSGTLFVLGAMNLIDCINVNLLTPYVDRMVSEFLGRPTNDPGVVQTVGLLIGLYSLCEVLFSPFWGYLADCLGRRPVMLIGLAGSAIAPVVFGFAETLPVAFLARGLDGFFCGNLGVTKTYLGEIVDSTNEARGFSFLAVCFSLGLFIGPMLGGQLVDPAVWLPGVFKGTTFERHPYLLPNLTYACFAVVSWLLGFCFLKETMPPWERKRGRRRPPQSTGLLQDEAGDAQQQRSSAAGAGGPGGAEEAEERRHRAEGTRMSLLFLASYCLLTGYFAAWTQNFVLIVSLPRAVAGFGLGPRQIGMIQNAAGVGLLSTQLLFYPRLTKRLGFLACFVGGCTVNILITLLFPAYGLMADPERFGAWRYAPLATMMFFGQAAAGFCFPTIFVWINRSLEGKDRGTWNGWFNSTGALFRSFFPPGMDALLSLGLRSGLPGGRYLPVFVNALAGLGTLCLAAVSVRAQARHSAARKIRLSSQQAALGEPGDAATGA